MSIIRDLAKNKYLYALAAPGFIFMIVFAYLPLWGHLIAFQKFSIHKGLLGSPWVGFDNFKFFFQGDNWIKITWNTVYLNGLFIVFGIGTAIVIALCLNEVRRAIPKKIVQSFVFMPYFISWLAVSMMVYIILNSTTGLLNRLLGSLEIEPVSWYNEPLLWPFILTFIYVWKTSGYYSVIFLATIAGISGEYYESARIDGATRLQQIRFITLPLLRPVILVLVLLSVGRIFYGDFGMIYGIVGDNGNLFETTDVIDTYSYRALRQLGNFGMSSAVVLYQSAMGLVAVFIFNSIAKKIDKDSALF
ncbi:ABC transporter permease subunit [Paenibacillus sp.]|uniref:ABC transporter permease n=1 Tax=Paenibacillus sp. TaxID=58172 RepID=UPI002810EEB3|nr:ABC transporter permease subunit [Paenibacillus sp.]